MINYCVCFVRARNLSAVCKYVCKESIWEVPSFCGSSTVLVGKQINPSDLWWVDRSESRPVEPTPSDPSDNLERAILASFINILFSLLDAADFQILLFHISLAQFKGLARFDLVAIKKIQTTNRKFEFFDLQSLKFTKNRE